MYVLRKLHWDGRWGGKRLPALFWRAGRRALSPKPRQRLLPFWDGLVPNFMLWIEDVEHIAAGSNCLWCRFMGGPSKNKELLAVDGCAVVSQHWHPPFSLGKVQHRFVRRSALFAAWPIGKGPTMCHEFSKSRFSLDCLPSQISATQAYSASPECSDESRKSASYPSCLRTRQGTERPHPRIIL